MADHNSNDLLPYISQYADMIIEKWLYTITALTVEHVGVAYSNRAFPIRCIKSIPRIANGGGHKLDS